MSLIRQLAGRLARVSGPLAWSQRSYSQEGEDLALHRIFANLRSGYYVDIGSHHPFRFSNTYLFYRNGWRGLCVDPLPGSARLFKRWRPRDVFVEMGVSREKSSLDYHMFNEPALNTFDPALANARNGVQGYNICGVKSIATDTLAAILDKYLPTSTKIDFMSVDVEGLDLQVLESNDWQRYRPTVVVAECLRSTLGSLDIDPIVRLLAGHGYTASAKTGHSVIFVGRD